MKRIEGVALEGITPFFKLAAKAAKRATCHRGQCGTVIVKDGTVLGEGYNSPPRGDESRRTCDKVWDYAKKPKYDKTCCVHAEWRAILAACKEHGDKIEGAQLYFMRIDEQGNFTDAGEPYCTTCSRLAMESGIAEFLLWNNNGADSYTASEYDDLSYAFHAK